MTYEAPRLKSITPRLVMEVLAIFELDELAQLASPLLNTFLRAGVMRHSQMRAGDKEVVLSELKIKPDTASAVKFLNLVLENPDKIAPANFDTVREVKDDFFMQSWASMLTPMLQANNIVLPLAGRSELKAAGATQQETPRSMQGESKSNTTD